MTAFEIRIVDIYNSHKKMRITSRKRKLKNIYKKNMQKRKFFKIEKNEYLNQVSNKLVSTVISHKDDSMENFSKTSKAMEKIKNNSYALELKPTSPNESTIRSDDSLQLLKKLLTLKNLNKYFLTNMLKPCDFNYHTDKKNLQDYSNFLFLINKEYSKVLL
jgi:hypothetical protein